MQIRTLRSVSSVSVLESFDSIRFFELCISHLTLQKCPCIYCNNYYAQVLVILCNYVLIWLNLQCTEYDFEHGTECLHLAQKYAKTSAALIDGPDSLWKVGVSHSI